jgi:hypothetical protein
MHYQKKKTIFKIDFEKTLKNVKAYIDQIPPQVRNGQMRRAIKGNVNATAYHIYRLFMSYHRKGTRFTGLFKTTNPSLAKVSNNSERTIRRHIEKLIDLKIVIRKSRAVRGIELALNTDILAFVSKEVNEAIKVAAAPTTPTAGIVLDVASAWQNLRQNLAGALPGNANGQKDHHLFS